MTTYSADNLFHKIILGEIPSHKVFEDDDVLAFMDVMPQSDGHVLVIPKVGSRNMLDADPQVLSTLIKRTQRVGKAVKSALKADGIRIAQFNEAAAGQTVFHLHFHIIPVYEGTPLRAHAGQMEDTEKLASIAQVIRSELAK